MNAAHARILSDTNRKYPNHSFDYEMIMRSIENLVANGPYTSLVYGVAGGATFHGGRTDKLDHLVQELEKDG